MMIYTKHYEEFGADGVSRMMDDIYDALYDAPFDGIEQYHAKAFDYCIQHNRAFQDIVSDVSAYRQDLISSDRECAACMLALIQLSIAV